MVVEISLRRSCHLGSGNWEVADEAEGSVGLGVLENLVLLWCFCALDCTHD